MAGICRLAQLTQFYQSMPGYTLRDVINGVRNADLFARWADCGNIAGA
jgi:hypothetical protein